MLSGRYGPYVKHGDVNATLPRGKEPTALTMDEAVQLIAERAAKGPSKAKGRRAKATAKADDATSPPRSGKAQAAKPKAKPGKGKAKPAEAPERRRSRLQDPHDGATQTQRRPPRSGTAEQARHPRLSCAAAGAKAGKREIARAFCIKGGDRIALKSLLAEMAEEGLLRRQPQGLQGARAPAARSPCWRSSRATPTAS